MKENIDKIKEFMIIHQTYALLAIANVAPMYHRFANYFIRQSFLNPNLSVFSLIKNLHYIVFSYSAILYSYHAVHAHNNNNNAFRTHYSTMALPLCRKCCVFTKYSALDSSMLSRETHNGVKVVQW